MKKTLFPIVLCSIFLLSTVSASRNLPWIDLITRDEWWADESLKRRNSAKLQSAYDHPDYALGWIAWRGSLELLDPESQEEIVEQWEIIGSFLTSTHPKYYPQVVTNLTEQWNLLTWPWKYTATKNSVTIHHTADGKLYRLPSDSLPWLQKIYEQHTVWKDRWDIGYNFLIDPQGRLYEWKSGWEWIAWWHANVRNSLTSLWIALLWNFENVKPTSKALHTLKHLTTLMTHQYSIDPNRDSVLFDRSQEEPYIEAHIHDASVLGHKDIKSTACPGEYLYSEIPEVTQEVAKRLQWIYDKKWWVVLIDDDFLLLERAVWSDDESLWVLIPRNDYTDDVSCDTFTDSININSCEPVVWWIRIELSYIPGSSWWHTVGISTKKSSKIVSFAVVRDQDLQDDVDVLKQQFPVSTVPSVSKIIDRIDAQKARSYLNDDISVLLYEPTKAWEVTVSCEGGCEIEVNGKILSNAKSIIIREEVDRVVGFIDLVRYESDEIIVRDGDGWVVQIDSFKRYSWENALNIYKWDISVRRQLRRDLDDWVKTWFTVVNSLLLREYLQWMGESSEAQHFEKTKSLAYLTKIYALFYRSGKNPHPSIPEWVTYTAIDDPRSFQRYLGAWIESTSLNWLQAVDATYDSIITYDWYVPILPYYHCSAGFTRSWNEKFGWTDTPWLTSRKDLIACESWQFEGHGVWMSGDGAEYLAQAGASAEEILEWYYEGIVFID